MRCVATKKKTYKIGVPLFLGILLFVPITIHSDFFVCIRSRLVLFLGAVVVVIVLQSSSSHLDGWVWLKRGSQESRTSDSQIRTGRTRGFKLNKVQLGLIHGDRRAGHYIRVEGLVPRRQDDNT